NPTAQRQSACRELEFVLPLWRCNSTTTARAVRRPPVISWGRIGGAAVARAIAALTCTRLLRSSQRRVLGRSVANVRYRCPRQSCLCRSSPTLRSHRRGKHRVGVSAVAFAFRLGCTAAECYWRREKRYADQTRVREIS